MSTGKRAVIIGASACGAKAASRIARLRPEYEVTMIDAGSYISYAACGIPYHISGKVRLFDDLLKTTYGALRDAEYFRKLKNIDVRTRTKAERIDRTAKKVHARDLATGAELLFEYDSLVLATGASPALPDIPGCDLDGVFHMTTMEDAAAIAQRVKGNPGGRAVIIGGGFIGVEAAEALGINKWDVTMLERESQLFPGMLDFEIASLIQEHLYEHMIEPEFNASVIAIEGEGGAVKAVKTAARSYDADLVIIAAGLRPNTALAREAGLETGATGALKVNRAMQTSDPDIYAGGDCVESIHLVTGAPCYLPLGSTANKHGRVIADNICGVGSNFPGVQGTFVCKAFEYSVGSTGLTEAQAKRLGLDAMAFSVCGFDKAHYYPDSQIMALKLVVGNSSRRLLGLQAVGRGDVARRIDVAATAIRMKATIDDLAHLDMAYAPPFSSALDVFVTALNVDGNIRTGVMKPVPALEVRKLLDEDDDMMILDVRAANEFRRARIDDPRVINIPLDELRARMGEVPRDKKVLCLCLLGLRGFSAQRMLEAAGFSDVHTVEGGMFLWPWKDEFA